MEISKWKQIDVAKTLENYEIRLTQYPKKFFQELDEAYVSDYNSHWNDVSHIPILIRITASHGFLILGQISAHQKKGEYVYCTPKNAKIIYVGKQKAVAKRGESRFCIKQRDYAYK